MPTPITSLSAACSHVGCKHLPKPYYWKLCQDPGPSGALLGACHTERVDYVAPGFFQMFPSLGTIFPELTPEESCRAYIIGEDTRISTGYIDYLATNPSPILSLFDWAVANPSALPIG